MSKLQTYETLTKLKCKINFLLNDSQQFIFKKKKNELEFLIIMSAETL